MKRTRRDEVDAAFRAALLQLLEWLGQRVHVEVEGSSGDPAVVTMQSGILASGNTLGWSNPYASESLFFNLYSETCTGGFFLYREAFIGASCEDGSLEVVLDGMRLWVRLEDADS